MLWLANLEVILAPLAKNTAVRGALEGQGCWAGRAGGGMHGPNPASAERLVRFLGRRRGWQPEVRRGGLWVQGQGQAESSDLVHSMLPWPARCT